MTRDYQQTEWSLADLLPDAEEETIACALSDLEESVADFERQRSKLTPEISPSGLLDLLGRYQSLQERSTVLGSYGSLWFAADTQSDNALTFRNRMEQVLTEVQNRTLFFSLWWKELVDDEADRLLPAKEEYPDEHHYLRDLRRLRPYILDERSEQIINMKDANGIGGVLTLYSMLTNRLDFRLEVDGEERVLTRDGVMSWTPKISPISYSHYCGLIWCQEWITRWRSGRGETRGRPLGYAKQGWRT